MKEFLGHLLSIGIDLFTLISFPIAMPVVLVAELLGPWAAAALVLGSGFASGFALGLFL